MTDHAKFTQQVRALVAENDRVPEQRAGEPRDNTKAIADAALKASGASPHEFTSAMLGVLSTKVDIVTWAESAALAVGCFRDRRSVGGE